jgi:hypothetical protein
MKLTGYVRVEGRKIDMYVKDTWLREPDGKWNPINVWDSPDIRTATTDSDGVARFELKDKARVPDTNNSYVVAVSFAPKQGDELVGCKGPTRRAYSLTPARNNPAPYPIYNNQGRIAITPETAEKFPDLADIVKHYCIPEPSADIDKWIEAAGSEKRAKEVLEFLMANNIVSVDEKGIYHWYRAVYSGPGPDAWTPGTPYIYGVEICDLKEYCV